MCSKGESQANINLSVNRFQLNLLRSIGLYPLANDVSTILRIIYQVYSVLFMFITATVVLCQILYLCLGDNLLESLATGASETIAFTLVLSKSVIFVYNVERNKKILNTLENSWRRNYSRRNSNKIWNIVTETEESIKRLKYVSCAFMFVTYLSFVGAPILTDYLNGTVIATEMPVKIWFPFQLNSQRQRAMVYVTACLAIYYIAFSMLGLVNLYTNVLSLLAAEFKVLKIDFMYFVNDYNTVHEMEHEKSIFFELKRNVENHQNLLQ